VLRATYANIKPITSRSTVQLVLEMPMEAMTDIVNLLGPPLSATTVWVAVARLREGATQQPALEEPRRGTLAQQAGILCNEPAFQRWVAEQPPNLGGDVGPAAYVRTRCGVASRADLDHDDAAAAKFRDLRADFKLWMGGEG